MSLIAENKGGEFEMIPEGTYIARCYRVVDLGTQLNEKFHTSSHKVMVSWEFPTELMEDGRPFAISKWYTLSLHEKANLRKDLEAWRGRKFAGDEAQSFDVSKLLGVPCYINVIHNTTGENVYANVSSIMALPEGVECPEPSNTPVVFDISNFDQDLFDTFSEKIQGMIKASPEYKNIMGYDEPATDVVDEGGGETEGSPF